MERYIITTVELATINVTWVNELNENHRYFAKNVANQR